MVVRPHRLNKKSRLEQPRMIRPPVPPHYGWQGVVHPKFPRGGWRPMVDTGTQKRKEQRKFHAMMSRLENQGLKPPRVKNLTWSREKKDDETYASKNAVVLTLGNDAKKVASALVPEGREATEVDQVNLFDDHEQNSESHVHQGGLSSGAEEREATEVDQVDLLDDHGLIVSSLVSIDCNEDRGNGPASLDKSFGEDKYVAKEKVVGGMMDNLSIDATDGSNVGENVFSEQKFSDMQLVGQDVLEEDAFVSGIGGLALNNLYPVYDFSGVQIINSKRNYKKNVLYIVNYWFTTLTYKTISIQYLQFQKI